MEKNIEMLARFIWDWPGTDFVTTVSICVSLTLAIIHTIVLFRSVKWGERLSALAFDELKRQIKSYAKRSLPLNPAMLITMAEDIQSRYLSPGFTYPMITEALRAVKLECEQEALNRGKPQFDSTDVVLDSVLKAYQGTRVRPMSIAYYNRLLAYCLAALAFSLGIASIQFVVALTLNYVRAKFMPTIVVDVLMIAIVMLLAFAQLRFIILAQRAIAFWRKQYERVSSAFNSPAGTKTLPILPWSERPTKRHDYFLYLANSNSYMELHVKSAATWEELLFHFLPTVGLPLLCGWLVLEVGRRLAWSYQFIFNAVITQAIVLLALVFILGSIYFANSHEYKRSQVKKLEADLDNLRKDLAKAQFGMQRLPSTFLTNYDALCDKLWVITGYEFYQELKRDMHQQLQLVNGTGRLNRY
jgi:hypothetical protein